MHCNNGLNNKVVESLVENKVAQETGDLKYLQDSMYDFVSTLKEIILGEYSPEFFNKYVDEALKLHGSNLEEFLKIPKMGLELEEALNSIDKAIDTSNQEFKDNLVLLLDRFQTTLDNMETELHTRIVSEVSSHVTSEADRAQSEADQAKAASDAAFVEADRAETALEGVEQALILGAANIYLDVATGLAATEDTDNFWVLPNEEDDLENLTLYNNNTSVAVKLYELYNLESFMIEEFSNWETGE